MVSLLAVSVVAGSNAAAPADDLAAPAVTAALDGLVVEATDWEPSPVGQDASDGSESAGEARELFGEVFGGEVAEPAEMLRLPEGAEVARYHGQYAARIEAEGEPDRLAVSALPLRAEDGSGRLAPVELTLDQARAELVPENPLVDVRIPDDLGDGITVGDDGLRVGPASGSAPASGELAANKVFYPEVARDTDWAVGPVATGAEVLLQLRSAEAPVRHVLDIDVPAGARLERSEDGGVEIVGDGDVVARVLPPAAADADGRRVPVTYEVENGEIAVVVGHRDQDYRFPVLVDPVVEDWATDGQGNYTNSWFTNPSLDQLGWEFRSSASGQFSGVRQGSEIATYGTPPGRGLYVFGQPNRQRLLGDYGYWAWRAPGRTTYLSRADFRTIYFQPFAAPGLPAAVTALWDTERSFFSGVRIFPTRLTGANTTVRPGDNVPGANPLGADEALFGMALLGPNRGPRWLHAYLGGAVLYLEDPEPATLTGLRAPSGWLGADDAVTASASDPGLGVRSIELQTPSGPLTRTHGCLGNRLSRCPESWSQDFAAGALPEGRGVTLSATATDALGKRSSAQSVQVDVDHSGPSLELSGALRDAAGGYVGDEPLDLHVLARDGDNATSGARSVEVLVDGERRDFVEQLCPDGGCSLGRDFTLDTAELGEGAHQVTVEAEDVAGNVSEQTWTIKADRTPPTLMLSGSFWERRGEWLDDGMLELEVDAVDGGSGVVRAELVIDGIRRELTEQPCADGGCALRENWSVDVGGLDEGRHLVQVLVLDAAGRLRQESWIAKVDRTDPTLQLSGPLADANGGEIGAGQHGLRAAAADGGSGLGSVEILLDGERKDLQEQPCEQGGCGLERDWTLDTTGLADGEHTVRVVATDQAGRMATREIEFRFDTGPVLDPPPLSQAGTTSFRASTSFLYEGRNPVQEGVASGTIEAVRAAVVEGRVTARDGAPLDGVGVSVVDHAEYGSTRTGPDGRFYMAVNGGGRLRLRFEKEGLLPSERWVDVPWQDYAMAEDVALTALDAEVTEIDLSQPGTESHVAKGSVVSDADGARQSVLLFKAGTEAEMVLPDGSREPLAQLDVRATEYTVGETGEEAMPGELPDTSAYTYAAEYSVDEALAAGAESVEFSRPVVSYVDDFVGFPAGTAVPVGYYDRGEGAWRALPDGRVVEIVGESGGLAQLDVTGDAVPSPQSALDELGIDGEERARLAELYEPGKRLWRTRLEHFTPVDDNWPPRFPPGAVGPDGTVAPESGGDCEDAGSIIGCESQTLGETIPITGTGLSLNYRSNRVPGNADARTLRMRVIGDRVPEELKQIQIVADIAGRRFEQTLPFDDELEEITASEQGLGFPGGSRALAPNAEFEFTWDGKDAFGRRVQGGQRLRVHIGFTYEIDYATAVPFGSSNRYEIYSFGQFPGDTNRAADGRPLAALPSAGSAGGGGGGGGASPAASSRPAARPTKYRGTIWRTYDENVGVVDARGVGLGGWTLDVHHTYDPIDRRLYLGDGTTRDAEDQGLAISAVPGTGRNSGVEATEGIEAGPDGSLYVADFYGDRVLRRDPEGRWATFAGTGVGGFAGDEGPAREAQLDGPADVKVDRDGGVLIADRLNHRVRRVAPDGTMATVAGDGEIYRDGDGGPATEATLRFPAAVDVGPDGSIYIADSEVNGRIRRVDPAGTITTVIGDESCAGCRGYSGTISGVAVTPDGTVWAIGWSSTNTSSLLRRRPGASPELVATSHPSNNQESNDDGIPVEQARFDGSSQLAPGPDNSVYLVESVPERVRRLTPDGRVHTVAGGAGGCEGYSGDPADLGDDGPARGACLPRPQDVAVAPDGTLYLSDWELTGVRAIRSSLPGYDDRDITVASQDGTELYQFDKDGRHLRTLNTLTGALVYRFGYDDAGRLVEIEDGDGLTTTIERGADGLPTAIVAPFGQRTRLAVDPNGFLSEVTNPADESFTLDSLADGLLRSFTDPNNHASSFSYDRLGRLTRDDDAAGGYKTLTRSKVKDGHEVAVETALGRRRVHRVQRLDTGERERKITYPNGLTASMREREGDSASVTRPDGSTASARLTGDPRFGMNAPFAASATLTTPGGRSVTIEQTRQATLTDPANPLSLSAFSETFKLNGRAWTSAFDPSLRRYTETSPAGRVSKTDVDARQRPTRFESSGITPTTVAYDTLGRPQLASQGDRSLAYSYDSKGRLATVTDALSRTWRYDYDNADRLVKETLPDLREIAYSYDATGNLTSVTPPSRPAHTFTHTSVDLTESYTPPLVGAEPEPTRYSYDADRELTEVVRPGGEEIDLGYDSAGRLETVTHDRGTTALGYDPDTGSLATASGPGGERVAFALDGFLATGESYSGTVSGEVTRSFDNDLRVASESVNGAHAVGYSYDADGLLTGAGELSLTRDAQNGLLGSTTLDGVTSTITRNGFGEPETVTARDGQGTVYAETYVRDAAGRIAGKTETRGSQTTSYAYGYDAAGRLERATKDGQLAASYRYDPNGNRTEVTRSGGGATSASYDAQDRLVRYGPTEYAYTPAGDLASKTDTAAGETTRYAYDSLGALRRVELPGGSELDYVVDPFGRRIAKRRDGRLEQGFLYGQGLGPLAELNPDGSVQSRFVYATRPNVPDYMVRDGRSYRIVVDQLGSPRAVVDGETGESVQEIDYDEFGRVTRDTNPGFQPFGYAGGLYDPDTGLVRFGARDYDPQTGRWTSKDPIGFAGGDTNLYGYVLADPVNLIDPSGLYGLRDLSDDVTGTIGEIDDVVTSGESAEFLGNEIVGFTNTVTFGQSNRRIGINGDCLGLAGDIGGLLGIPVGAAGAVRGVGGAGTLVSKTQPGRHLFGRGHPKTAYPGRGVLNKGDSFRIGMGWNGRREIFRIAKGTPSQKGHRHFDFLAK